METGGDGSLVEELPEVATLCSCGGPAHQKTVVLCHLTGIHIASRVTALLRVWRLWTGVHTLNSRKYNKGF